LLGAAVIVGSSLSLDPYGLFLQPRGAHRQVFASERTSKYLLARRYVPANFDALLLGGSISSNWNTQLIQHPRVYNASISGANLSEEKLIADEVLAEAKLRWLVLCVHPYLTMTRGRKTEYMTPREYWSALGSLDLFFVEGSKLLVDSGLKADHHNEFGDSDYTSPGKGAREQTDAYIEERRRSGKPHHMFNIAPGALDDFRDLVARAAAAGVRLAVVYPPVYKPRFDVERGDWEGYWRKVELLLPPGTRYLNFNAPQFDAERDDFANFQDGAHLRRAYADKLVLRIGALLQD